MSESLCRLPIHQLRQAIERGTCDPRELVHQLLDHITQRNPSLSAYMTVDPERLKRQLEERVQHGPRGRLFGIPITVKDNLCVTGEETTCASRMLTGFRPPYSATVIERLRAEGAIIIPRANMDEFAFGSSTETSHFGPTKNPRDPERVPGGSSGGSAAAVASDLALGALGTDTGGSIRQPAAFCGVVGLKPTYGRVSRYGLIAFASSLDQIGPITKDVTDCALLLSVIAGHDPKDSTSAPTKVDDYVGGLSPSLQGVRIGLPAFSDKGLDEMVRERVGEALKTLWRLGARPVEVALPHIDQSIATYYIIATAEASSNLARYDGVQYGYRAQEGKGQGARGEGEGSRSPKPTAQNALIAMYQRTRQEGFGEEAKRRIILGTYVLSRGYYDAYYLKGLKVRTLIKQGFDEAFKRCDVIVMPTSPTAAFRLGEKLDDPLQMYLSDIYTISANLAGVPAVSVPCGFTSNDQPVGLQLLANTFEEAKLLQVAYAYEQSTERHHRKPVISEQ